jgi:pyroglutamyl-peptidase
MAKNILLTSFTTWLPHQKSNSSDDLLAEISKINHASSLTFLRRLPVDAEKASSYLIDKINEITPDAIICCGMAECRHELSIESNATCGDMVLKTNIELKKLVHDAEVQISHDAGKFVCEGLYYTVLKYILDSNLNISCIFVHVPILTEENFASVLADFMLIIQKLRCY